MKGRTQCPPFLIVIMPVHSAYRVRIRSVVGNGLQPFRFNNDYRHARGAPARGALFNCDYACAWRMPCTYYMRNGYKPFPTTDTRTRYATRIPIIIIKTERPVVVPYNGYDLAAVCNTHPYNHYQNGTTTGRSLQRIRFGHGMHHAQA